MAAVAKDTEKVGHLKKQKNNKKTKKKKPAFFLRLLCQTNRAGEKIKDKSVISLLGCFHHFLHSI